MCACGKELGPNHNTKELQKWLRKNGFPELAKALKAVAHTTGQSK